MEKLPVIEAWGPYLFHRFTRPYVYTLGRHLALYQRAVEPIAYLQQAIAAPERRPSMIAFPHGFQGNDWVLEPEAIAFDTLCYFIAGWQGSIAYFFPNGYDARYWRAMAEANTLIADHEEIVFKGQRQAMQDRFHLQQVSTLPPFDPLSAPDLDPGLLQGQEYVYGDRRLLAVGNFWQRGDVYVQMTPTNLPAEGRFVVREISRNRHFSGPRDHAWWTTEELRQGVNVHVGALRWAFFTIEPWREDGAYGAKLTASEIVAHLKAFRQELEMNVKEETTLSHVQRQQVEPPDLSTFTPVTLGGVTCQLASHTNDAGQDVVFVLPDGHLVINPANGAKITSWRHKGVELTSSIERFGLGRDGFMLPSPPYIDGPYALDTQTQSETDLSITFRKELTADVYGYELDGLTLYKTYTIPTTGGSFTVKTMVRNDSDHEVTFAFRYHNVPAVVPDDQAMAMWQASMPGSADQPQIYDMPQGRVELFRYKQEPVVDIDKIFKSSRQYVIDQPTLTVQWPQSPFSVSIDCLTSDSLYGIMFWGFAPSGHPHATLEPLYDKVNLAQGQSWTAGMRWTIKP